MTSEPPGDVPFVDQLKNGPGESKIDASDPAAPYFELLSHLRSPLTLRELMIQSVRTGYIGQDHPIDPHLLPPSASDLYPEISVAPLVVPCALGRIRCEVYARPGARQGRPVMVYIHGGGFTVGTAGDTAYITSRIADETGLIVVSVNYRLAPEWPFPSGLDDILTVLAWLRDHAAEIGGNPDFILAGGDSAGGNLAAALPHKARDAGVRPPEAVVLLCPITDFNVEQHPSFEQLAPRGIVYDTAFVGYIRGAYVVHHALWSHPHVSPALGDLASYPPALVVSGEVDPMIDDNRAFVKKLDAAGRRVTHVVGARMPHGFYFFPKLLAEGEKAFAAIRQFAGEIGVD